MRILVLMLISVSVYGQKFRFVEKPSEKKIDVFYGDKHITSYIYFDSLFKTAYYPIATLSGTHVTREYPYVVKAGERADHPHHVGLFFAHESVNGHDFWNMSTAIAPSKRVNYGTEIHEKASVRRNSIVSTARWRANDKEDLLREQTTMRFTASKNDLIIDRVTTLTALTDVTFTDKKDALMGLRVARELELPVEGKDRFVKADGSISEPMENDKSKVTGEYKNSESVIGQEVWGKKANWVCLDGKLANKDISIAMIDHPANTDYPSYWHARGYGLFAVNPLGKEVFTEGKAKLNLFLKKGEQVVFRYRIIVRERGKLTPAELNQYLKGFSTR
ncbi:MAG TPA: PmoA family protein [Cyclobacteriaceae bacterium]